MKIAFSISGDDLTSPLDSRFGRAAKFLIYDTQSLSFEVIDNSQNLAASQGAGVQAAQNVVQAGVGCVITGHCGPKAFRALSASGVKVYNTDSSTVSEALERYLKGALKEANSADVNGHWV